MGTWTYILIGIVVLFLVLYSRMKKALGMPVLETEISTQDGFMYQINFNKLHPETKPIEYVRMILNFVAKIVFIIEKKHEYVRTDILNFIEDVSNTNMTQDELKKLIPPGLNYRESSKAEGKTVKGILYYSSATFRNIVTKLPITWFEYQLFHSIVVLLVVTCGKLDEAHRIYLKDSLKYMSRSYKDQATNLTSGIVMKQLPNESFLYRNS